MMCWRKLSGWFFMLFLLCWGFSIVLDWIVSRYKTQPTWLESGEPPSWLSFLYFFLKITLPNWCFNCPELFIFKDKPESSMECTFITIHMWEKPSYVNKSNTIINHCSFFHFSFHPPLISWQKVWFLTIQKKHATFPNITILPLHRSRTSSFHTFSVNDRVLWFLSP